MRTLVQDAMDTAIVNQRINSYFSMIDPIVQNDPIANYSYSDFLISIGTLKNFVRDRRSYILGNSEMNVSSPVISNTVFYSNTVAWQRPQSNQNVSVTTSVTSSGGINKVTLYSSTGLVGKFNKTTMFDDGLHNDQSANDGIYGADISGMSGGTWVRFYIEATSNNSAKTVAYDPLPKPEERKGPHRRRMISLRQIWCRPAGWCRRQDTNSTEP
jgi:hypothetical protein